MLSLVGYTGRLSCHGFVGYREPDALDVTRGTADIGATFAPSRALLNEAQRRKKAAKGDEQLLQAAFDWYAPLYIAEMRGSYRTHREDWDALLSHDLVTLCCYCGTAQRCHRRLLAEILVKLGATYQGER